MVAVICFLVLFRTSPRAKVRGGTRLLIFQKVGGRPSQARRINWEIYPSPVPGWPQLDNSVVSHSQIISVPSGQEVPRSSKHQSRGNSRHPVSIFIPQNSPATNGAWLLSTLATFHLSVGWSHLSLSNSITKSSLLSSKMVFRIEIRKRWDKIGFPLHILVNGRRIACRHQSSNYGWYSAFFNK